MRKLHAALLTLTLLPLFVGSSAQAAEREPITILTVGDSITYGALMNNQHADSYRTELGRLLDQAGQPYRFATAAEGGTTCGYWSSQMHNLMTSVDPDVVLIACGTNDSFISKTPAQIEAWEGMYRGLFDTVFDTDPDVIAYPAWIQYSAATVTSECTLNGALPNLRRNEAMANDAIYRAMKPIDEYGDRMPTFIDYQGISEAYLDGCGVHPTMGGYDLMGRIAFNTIAPKLGLPLAPAPCGLIGRRDGYTVPTNRKPCQEWGDQ